MENIKYDSHSAETLVKWYLRLNGYFTVDNFIVHAGDDPSRISNDYYVGNHAEVDVLAIRHQFSREKTGTLLIANDKKLINSNSKIDFVIAETKTGDGDNSRRPNSIWRNKNLESIKYLVRFAGFIEQEATISSIAEILARDNCYVDPSGDFSIRLIVFSECNLNKNWQHLVNIKINEIIDFIVNVRGECWIQQNIGVASIHQQWDRLINEIFEIANDMTKNPAQRIEDINFLMKRQSL